MASIVDRMIRAARLDVGLYEEIEKDEGSMGQAMAVVAISSVAAGIGSAGFLGPVGLIGGALAALVGWFIWALLAHFIGTTVLAEPATRASLVQVMRVTGFSAAPGVIRIFAFIPLLGTLVNLAASLWMLAAFIVAVRQVLNYSSTGRSVAVCLLGWLVQIVIFSLLAMIGLGGIALMSAR
ncbi:MAG: YIP1 family protein [Candidatus Krumholzibacteriota bacterium]